MTEEEKREKLLKLKYDSHKTDATAFYGACIAFFIASIILNSDEFARETNLWVAPLFGSLGSFMCAIDCRSKMLKYQEKLAKMYAPKKKDQSEQKKRGKGER